MNGRTQMLAMTLGLMGLASIAQGPSPALGLHVSLPYSAYAPGQDMTLFLIVRNRGGAPVSLPSRAPVRVEAEVAGRTVSLEEVTAEDGSRTVPAGPEVIIGPGDHLIRPVVIRLDRTLFLPGEYPLRVALDLSGRGVFAAEATLTVRYQRIFFY